MSGFSVNEGRTRKAELIAHIIARFSRKTGPGLKICDMGCGSGIIGYVLSGLYEVVLQDTVDQRADQAKGMPFYRTLPKEYAAYFDIVLLNHVLPHTDAPSGLLDEVARVLAPGGGVYLALPNRWFPVEPIYRIPLIHWLPVNWFNRIARFFFGKKYEPVCHFSPKQVARLVVRHGFFGENVTRVVLKEPDLQRLLGLNHWMGWLAARVAFLMPTQIWVLRKVRV